jgi:hypothetical protein
MATPPKRPLASQRVKVGKIDPTRGSEVPVKTFPRAPQPPFPPPEPEEIAAVSVAGRAESWAEVSAGVAGQEFSLAICEAEAGPREPTIETAVAAWASQGTIE